MAYGAPPIDWTKPVRWHAAKGILFEHEGWGVNKIYHKTRSILEDLLYDVQEVRYVFVPPNTPDGENYAHAWFRCVYEVDHRFANCWIWANTTLTWGPRPKPGSDPKNPAYANYGKVKMILDGYMETDTLARWSKSPILRLLRPVREKYFYYDKIEITTQSIRNDIATLIEKLREYINYIPTII